MEKKPKAMWTGPWGYRQSAAVVAGIIMVGWLLQFTVGGINFHYLAWPVNISTGLIIIFTVAILALNRKSAFFRWISGVPLSVTLIATLVILGVIMGLFPQFDKPTGHHHDNIDIIQRVGFTSMTSSWPFVLVYVFTLLSLGCVILRRLAPFRPKDYAFHLNHIGLWLLLLAAGMGAADMRRYMMHVREGEVEWRVYNERGDVMELPIAIELNDFDMEEYPPKLAIIDRETGSVQPESKPVYFPLDGSSPNVKAGRWELSVEEYIHHAVRNSDSTYREVYMPGATPAARVGVRDTSTNKIVSGWVCAGNIAQLYMVLNLDDDHSVVMTRPEPKRYMSDIIVYTQDGKQKNALLEVNKPVRVGHWTLYQYGYDSDAGRMSTYSSIELVYDPWVVPVYIGIILLAAGSVCMLWSGNRRKEDCDDLG